MRINRMKKLFILNLLPVLMILATPLCVNAGDNLRGDCDNDGLVNINDVTSLISYLLNAQSQVVDGHEWVDLGLPSGTLWATCNVGANSPENYGDYFAWGETEPKDNYDWSTYKWCNGSNTTLTKYCTNSSYGYNGFTDGKTELELEDDAAYVNWSSSWRTPTENQWNEITAYCSEQWFERNGVRGKLITGPNGNTLFLPAAGQYYWSQQSGMGSSGDYWVRDGGGGLFVPYLRLEFFTISFRHSVDWRQIGRSVRPLLSRPVSDVSFNGDVNLDGSINIKDVTALITYLLKQHWSDEFAEHEWVDLGLPSGTLWATCNVGANSPEEYGDYFAWGETMPKFNYTWSPYKWCNGSDTTLTKYCTDSSYGYNGFVDNKTELDPEDDAAYINWGPSWRMPTTEQQRELYENCSSVWTTQNGVNGRLITGPNGNTMFLPAAGYRWYTWLRYEGSEGRYWSRTLYSINTYSGYKLNIDSGYWEYWYGIERDCGLTVRAVRVSQN